jgi:hypothetical protein
MALDAALLSRASLVLLVLAIGGWNFSSFIYIIAILICPLSMLHN